MKINYESFLERTKELKVIVFGDQYLDLNGAGGYVGYSRENPAIPILGAETILFNPGGGANLATNFASIPILTWVIGIWGKDIFRIQLEQEFQAKNINVDYMTEGKATGVFGKYYFVNGNHVSRVDFIPSRICAQMLKKLSKRLRAAIEDIKPDLIFVADYDEVRKGICWPVILEIIRGSKIPSFGTSRKRLKELIGLDFLFMNQRELIEQFPSKETLVEKIRFLLDFTNCGKAVVTLSGAGASVYWKKDTNEEMMDNNLPLNCVNIQSIALQDVDACGCGDTFAAFFAVAIVAGYDDIEAGKIGNAAARAVSRKRFGAAYPESIEVENEYDLIEQDLRKMRRMI